MRTAPWTFRPLLLGLALLLVAPPAQARPDKETVERAMTTLERATRSGDFDARAMAVGGLGFGSARQVLPMITEALEDPQWQVRRAAIEALRQLRQTRAWDQAIDAAMRDRRVDADQLIDLLEPLGARVGVATLMKSLRDAKFPEPARYVRALARRDAEWLVAGFEAGLSLRTEARGVFEEQLHRLPLETALPLHQKRLAKYDPAVQKRIIEQARALDRRTDLPFIRPLVRSGDADVAFEAARLLGERGDATGRALLVTAASSSDPRRRLAAMQALVPLARDDLFDLCRELVKEREASTELLIAAYEIFHRGGNPRLAEHLERTLASTDLNHRAAAVHMIGRVKGRAALDELVPLLGAGPEEIRRAAAHALGALGARDAIAPLRGALDQARSPDLALAYLEALGAIRDADVVPVVRFRVQDPDTRIRRVAVRILADLRHESAAPDLELALQDRDREIRSSALKALVELDPARHFPQFERALAWLEPDYVRELVAARKDGARRHLEAALESSREEVRAIAFRALDELSAKARLEVLERLVASSRWPQLRRVALDRLVELQGRSARETLERLVRDRDELLRVSALAALGQLGVRESLPLLTDAADDPNERVRVAAAAALVRL